MVTLLSLMFFCAARYPETRRKLLKIATGECNEHKSVVAQCGFQWQVKKGIICIKKR